MRSDGSGSCERASSRWAAVTLIAAKIGCTPQTLHDWVKKAEGVANCEEIIAVPGLGFAEIGPGDLSLALGYRTIPSEPFPPEMQKARDRILVACRRNGAAFLQSCTPDNVIIRIEEGVRVFAGHSAEAAARGRAHQKRNMPV